MRISETCIQRPVFASVLSLIIVLIGLISYSRLTVREYPKIDEPIVSVDTTYKGASPEVIESQVTAAGRPAGRHRRRGRDDLAQPLRAQPDQHQVQPEARSGRGGGRGAGQGLARAALPARRDRRAHHRQGRGRFPAHHLHRRRIGFAVRHPDLRLHQPLHQDPPVGAARRGRGARVRRAAAVHAHLCGPRQAGGLRADGAGRRGLAAQPERRDPGWPHRVAGARVLGGVVHRPADDQAVRECDRRQRQGLSGAAARRGQDRDRSGQ